MLPADAGGNSTADVIAQQSAVDKFLFHLLQTMILNVSRQHLKRLAKRVNHGTGGLCRAAGGVDP